MDLELLSAFRYALAAGVAVAAACSLLSPFVVYKRMAFVGQGVSHAGFGGIGIAFLAGLWVPAVSQPGWMDVVLALSCVATALAIGRLSAGALESDSAIGVALVVAMAVGIAGMDLYAYLRPGTWQPDIHGLLFGDIFSASPAATAWASLIAALVLVLVLVGYRQLVFYTFDEEGALLFGAPVRAVQYIFLIVMALAVVAAMRLVGVVLVTALLVMPGLIGRALAGRFATALAWSLVSGVVGTAAGLLLVIFVLTHLSSGPAVVLVLAAMLVAAGGARAMIDRTRRARAAAR